MAHSRTKLVSARLTDAEYAAVQQAAGGEPLSIWARAVLLRAARRPAGEDAPATTTDSGNARVPSGAQLSQERTPSTPVAVATPPWAPEVRRTPATQLQRSRVRLLLKTFVKSPAWPATILIAACVTGGGIAASRYSHDWTPLQRQYLWPYLWSGWGITQRGSYDFLILVDRTVRRTARDADVEPIAGRDAFRLSAAAIRQHADHLEWERRQWDHAVLHAFLQQAIYEGQSPLDLARPSVFSALAVLLIGLLPIVSDALCRILIRVIEVAAQRTGRGR
jgi:hypothetical protein